MGIVDQKSRFVVFAAVFYQALSGSSKKEKFQKKRRPVSPDDKIAKK